MAMFTKNAIRSIALDKPQHSDHSERKRFTWLYDNDEKNIRLTKIVVSVFAVVLSIIIFILCVYFIIPSIIYGTADSLDKSYALQMYESTLTSAIPDDTAEPVFVQPEEAQQTPKPRDCFAAALAQNPDIIGRVALYDIGITYPVTQSKDNEYYLKTGYNGKGSRLGTVFLDYRCNAEKQPLKGHYILYGHSFDYGGLFNNLIKYKDKNTFYNSRIIQFDTLYQDYKWEVFSVYKTSIDFNFIKMDFKNGSEWLSFLQEIQQKSIYKTDTLLTEDDVLLTLCTCVSESENERLVIHARLIK
jgi:sortase B